MRCTVTTQHRWQRLRREPVHHQQPRPAADRGRDLPGVGQGWLDQCEPDPSPVFAGDVNGRFVLGDDDGVQRRAGRQDLAHQDAKDGRPPAGQEALTGGRRRGRARIQPRHQRQPRPIARHLRDQPSQLGQMEKIL